MFLSPYFDSNFVLVLKSDQENFSRFFPTWHMLIMGVRWMDIGIWEPFCFKSNNDVSFSLL